MATLDIVLIKKSSDFYLYFKQIIAQSDKLFVLYYKGVFRSLSNIHDGVLCNAKSSILEYAFVLCSIITFQFYLKDLKLRPWQL